MKNLTIGVVVILSCIHIHAQQKGKIYGMVYENDGRGLRLATISVLHLKDSSLVKADLSGDIGQFEIIVSSPGSFFLRYSATGFETAYSDPFELKEGQSYTVPPVRLQITSTQLKDVTLISRKPLIQVKPGKTVFNVQNSINATGSNALELLQKSPGVIVDNNDNIMVKGKAGVKIYIDGKMLQLGPEDVAAYLKSMNSLDIEAIEIINNPGARYDAAGNAGIINIRLRKSNNMGTNGTFSGGVVQGITPKVNGALNINYRNRKLNIFSNTGVNLGRNQTDIIAPRTQKDTLYHQQLWQLSYNNNFNIKAGVDYSINSKQTLGVMANSNFNDEDWKSRGNTEIYYKPSDEHVKRLVATNSIPRKRTSVNTNLNYKYADTTGKEINVDADHGLFRGRAKSYQPNYYFNHDGNLISEVVTRNYTPTDIDIYTARAEMVLPLGQNKLGFGGKLSYVKTSNTLDFFTDMGGVISKSPERSYHFIYKEKVNAAYVTYQRQFNLKWTLQAGLRMEQTQSKGILSRGDGVMQADNNVKRNYLDWFPNAVLTWAIDPKNTLNLSYTRRIDRPNYQSLNPFELKLDELSYVKGNSFLRPQYTDNIELAHTWKNQVNTSIGYSYIKDLATQTVDTLNNYTYAHAKNLANQKIAVFNISSPLTINKWWSGFVNAWVNHQVFKGKVNQHHVSLESWAYGAFTQQSFTLGNDYTAELSGWFNGPSPLGPTLLAKSMGGLDIGLQKLLFQKKATLKLSVTDVFRTAVPFRGKTDFGGVLLKFWVTRESQTARINFTYRFGSNKIKAARQRQSGLETEVKRIKDN